jgi:uncharacterized protein
MPVSVTYPGVYVEEIASGVRTITGVSTSVTAFVGRALRGPADRPLRVQSFTEFERVYGGLWSESTLGYAVYHFFLNGGTDAVIARVHQGATKAKFTFETEEADAVLLAATEGKWGSGLTVKIEYEREETAPPPEGEATPRTLFNLTIADGGNGPTEVFRNLSTVPGHARFVTKVLEAESQLARVDGTFPASLPGTAPSAPAIAGGSDGTDITDTDVQSGLKLLDKVDLFNILCIPPLSRTADVAKATWDEAAKVAERRRAFLIVDAPAEWDSPDDVVNTATAVTSIVRRSNHAAMYFPRIMAANPLQEQRLDSFAACGAIAGIYSRTDVERGIWKAPAGIEATLAGVSSLSFKGKPGLLTDGDIGQLNPIGVNCLRNLPAAGHVVWGARTLAGSDQLASEWKYIPVRRLALYIEESLFRGTQWVVFEPNDEPLWSQIRLNVGAFMHTLFRQGAFQGVTPREAYFVKCSRETTTQTDVDSGIVNILVGFAPLKPAEFVVIRIQQIAQRSA